MYRMFLLALCLFCTIPSAFADESVVVDGVRYQIAGSQVALFPGEVLQIGKTCTANVELFSRTETCRWAKAVTATGNHIVVTGASSSTTTETRTETVYVAISIALMSLAFMLASFNYVNLVGALCIIASTLTLCVGANVMKDSLFDSLVGIGALMFAMNAFASSIHDNGRISPAKKKLLLISLGAYITLMLLLFAILW